MDAQPNELQAQGFIAAEAGDYETALRLYRDALTALREWPLTEEQDTERSLLVCIGYAAQRCNQFEVARKHYEQAVRFLRNAPDDDRSRLADALHRLGDTHIQRGEPGIARVYLMESAEISVHLRDYNEAAHVLEDLADFAIERKDWDEAQTHLHDCLRMARQNYNVRYQIYALCGLAELSRTQNAPDSAAGYFAEAQSVLADNEVAAANYDLWERLTQTAERLDILEVEIACGTRGLRLARDAGDLRAMAWLLLRLGCRCKILGRTEEAKEYLMEAVTIQQQIRSDNVYGSLWLLANLAYDEKQWREAEKYYAAALSALAESQNEWAKVNILFWYAHTLRNQFRPGRVAFFYGVIERALETIDIPEKREMTAAIVLYRRRTGRIFFLSWCRGRLTSLAKSIADANEATNQSVKQSFGRRFAPVKAGSAKNAPR